MLGADIDLCDDWECGECTSKLVCDAKVFKAENKSGGG